MSDNRLSWYEGRFALGREAWDEIAREVPAISFAKSAPKMLEALSGVRFLQPSEADMNWAKAAVEAAKEGR